MRRPRSSNGHSHSAAVLARQLPLPLVDPPYTAREFYELGTKVGVAFEEEDMRLARLGVAAKYGESPWLIDMDEAREHACRQMAAVDAFPY